MIDKHFELIVRHQAQLEVEEIYFQQYAIDPARAERFYKAWELCLEQFRRNPSMAKRKGHYGHVLLYKLPYRVVFEVLDNKVIVYQVRHTRRKPSKKYGP